MRQIFIEVPHGRGSEALGLVRAHHATNAVQLQARAERGELDLVMASVSNAKLGGLLDALERIPELHVTFAPQGVLALRPPSDSAHDQVQDVAPRSPVEIFLSGLQSIGSWKGFLAYASISGIVAWIGLFTNTVYLLTAAMLIAPFAGPAMNAALATARGDGVLLRRSVFRYFASLAVNIAAAAVLTLIMQQQIATAQMVEVSELSTAAVLLPLAAGAAGAVNLSQSGRSSLVSGAATGMLVAASLAPPAALIGMAAVIGKWAMVKSAGFVLVLQIVGINLSGALVFRLFGLKHRGSRYDRGSGRTVIASMVVTAAALIGLLVWQFGNVPDLQRSTRSQRAAAAVHDVVAKSGIARLVEANMRFTRSEVPGQDSLLGVVYVQRTEGTGLSKAEVEQRLTAAIQGELQEQRFAVTPLVSVTALGP